MAKLPTIAAQAVRAFGRAGWRQDRQKGSHVILLKEGQTQACPCRNTVPSRRGHCGRLSERLG